MAENHWRRVRHHRFIFAMSMNSDGERAVPVLVMGLNSWRRESVGAPRDRER